MKLISSAKLRVASTGGAVHLYPANEPFEADGYWLAECLKLGAQPVGGQAIGGVVVPPAADNGFETDPDETQDLAERLSLVKTAIEELVTRNDPAAFTGSGQPRVNFVAAILGEEVTREEVAEAFALVKAIG